MADPGTTDLGAGPIAGEAEGQAKEAEISASVSGAKETISAGADEESLIQASKDVAMPEASKIISEDISPEKAPAPVEESAGVPVSVGVAAAGSGLSQRKPKDSQSAAESAGEALSAIEKKPSAPAGGGEKGPLAYADIIAKVMPFLQMFMNAIATAAPHAEKAWNIAKDGYAKLPKNVIGAVYGVAICFFGGTYVCLIAAVEAYRLSGAHESVMKCVSDIAAEGKKVNAMNKKDDMVDDDNDGIPDVEQIDKKELVFRKWALIMRTVNPVLISNAFGGLYTAFVAIIGTLQVKFIRTVALALSMAKALEKPANRVFGKFLKELIPEGYQQWIPVVIGYVTKLIAMSIAWYLQRVVSAVQSAIAGGLTAARHALAFANEKGWLHLKDDETMLDEFAGWGLAAFGIYFQLMHGFSVGFPFNIVLFPMTVMEYVLQWFVTYSE